MSRLPGKRGLRPGRRRLVVMVVGVCAGFVLVEAALQVVAWVLWSNGQVEEWDRGEAQSVALCIGDSFTLGLQASAPNRSYPAQAQEIVAATSDRSLAFVNDGVPGQTSRDVLERLPGSLGRYRPDLVYVLVGTNDYFVRPTPLDLSEDATADPGFPIRWRTRRLLLLVIDWLRSGDPDETAPFVGVWHSSDAEVEIAASGEVQFLDQRFLWSLDDAGVPQLYSPGGEEVPISMSMDGRRLRVVSEGRTFLLEPGPLPGPISDVLLHHLKQVVASCRRAGARCVLLNYPGGPFARPGLNEQLLRSAELLDVDFVDVEERFKAIAESGDVESYYAEDGHCSDRGYAEIARLVAEHAIRTR